MAGEASVHIDVLAQVVGADTATTRALLVEVAARGCMKTDKEMWSLLSRNALPTAEGQSGPRS